MALTPNCPICAGFRKCWVRPRRRPRRSLTRSGARMADKFKIPMSSPDLTAAERRAVARVLDTPRLSMGPELAAFEAALAATAGVAHAVAVSSGTAALHLCVRAAGLGVGDLVLTTPFSFVASANALLYERAIPVFVDVDRRTGNIDPEQVGAGGGGPGAGGGGGPRGPGRRP